MEINKGANDVFSYFNKGVNNLVQKSEGHLFWKKEYYELKKEALKSLTDSDKVPISQSLTDELWDELISKGYIDNAGRIADSIRNSNVSLSLNLSDKFGKYENQIFIVLQQDNHISTDELKKAKDDKNISKEGKSYIEALLSNNEDLYKSMMDIKKESFWGNDKQVSFDDFSEVKKSIDIKSGIADLINYFSKGEQEISSSGVPFFKDYFIDKKALNRITGADHKPIGEQKSSEIWEMLVGKGYVDGAGRISGDVRSLDTKFTLDIDKKYDEYKSQLLIILQQDSHISQKELNKAKNDPYLSENAKLLINLLLDKNAALYSDIKAFASESLLGNWNNGELSLADLCQQQTDNSSTTIGVSKLVNAIDALMNGGKVDVSNLKPEEASIISQTVTYSGDDPKLSQIANKTIEVTKNISRGVYGQDYMNKTISGVIEKSIKEVNLERKNQSLPLIKLSEQQVTQYASWIMKYSKKYELNPLLVTMLIKKESNFVHKFPNGILNTSRSGAIGLTQLMPATASTLYVDSNPKNKRINPRDPEQSIDGGCQYLRDQLNTFNDLKKALGAYNSGPGNVDNGSYLKIGETIDYMDVISNNYLSGQLEKMNINFDEVVNNYDFWRHGLLPE